MEPAPDPIDLSPLDPSRDAPRWDALATRVVARAAALRRWRRVVRRRGVVAVALAAAAGLMLWLSAPRTPPPRATPDVLDWATREVSAGELLELGGVGDAR